jgi:hypothetical protein
MSPVSESFLETLSSYLEGRKEAGVRSLPWNGPLPSEGEALPPDPPPPPRPAPAPPLEKRPVEPALPSTPKADPVVVPSAPGISWIKATRHADCTDTEWPEDGWILVVSEQDEFEKEAGTLLKEMLHAIGFVPTTAPTAHQDGIPPGAERVLVMGDPALQVISTAGMQLQIVRGLWQETTSGRMVATYAPSAVVDSPSGKKTVWGDLQLLLEDLRLEIPEWTRKRLKKR